MNFLICSFVYDSSILDCSMEVGVWWVGVLPIDGTKTVSTARSLMKLGFRMITEAKMVVHLWKLKVSDRREI